MDGQMPDELEFVDFRSLAGIPGFSPPPRAAIFVHGIFSNHETFRPLVAGLRKVVGPPSQFGMYYFDYNFNRSIIDNGRELGEAIHVSFGGRDIDVSIVGHSMGGLVARAALLQEGDAGVVKRLVMLGTPNHGTIHTARLGLLAHMAREATGFMWIMLARKSQGIKQLSEIARTFDPLLREGARRTQGVDYITIPGLRFHQESGWLGGEPGTSRGLRALHVMMRMSEWMPWMATSLRLPHDGIVEEQCVQLSSDSDRFSERPMTPSRQRYCHITHPDYHEVDHVTVQTAERTIGWIGKLLSVSDLQTWLDGIARDGVSNIVR